MGNIYSEEQLFSFSGLDGGTGFSGMLTFLSLRERFALRLVRPRVGGSLHFADSGREVEALNGAPGGYSARYAGPNATDRDRYEKLLREMENVPDEKRTARFVSAICCVFPDGTERMVRGECEGRIARAPSGNGGFGYDPVFLVGDRTYGELSAEEKDAISHRGRALRALQEALRAR